MAFARGDAVEYDASGTGKKWVKADITSVVDPEDQIYAIQLSESPFTIESSVEAARLRAPQEELFGGADDDDDKKKKKRRRRASEGAERMTTRRRSVRARKKKIKKRRG